MALVPRRRRADGFLTPFLVLSLYSPSPSKSKPQLAAGPAQTVEEGVREEEVTDGRAGPLAAVAEPRKGC